MFNGVKKANLSRYPKSLFNRILEASAKRSPMMIIIDMACGDSNQVLWSVLRNVYILYRLAVTSSKSKKVVQNFTSQETEELVQLFL